MRAPRGVAEAIRESATRLFSSADAGGGELGRHRVWALPYAEGFL
jgi:hypothetical protein